MTHVDLFSGIGGFAIAAQRCGFQTVCFSEVNNYAKKILNKHWPNIPNVGDIRAADFTPYRGSTLLTGGFPCQPFSVAGKQLAKEDDRYLWPAMLEVIKSVRPTWVIGENVTGIVKLALDEVLSDLEGAGYSAVPFNIPACSVDAHHRRKRIWIVAHSNSAGLEGHSWNEDNLNQQGRHNAESGGSASESSLRSGRSEWSPEPELGRAAYGIPNRVDRITSLGNAIVPQVAEQIIRGITEIERRMKNEKNKS